MLTNPVSSSNEAPPPPPGTTTPRHRAGLWIAGGTALVGCVVVGIVDPNTTQLLPACAFKAATGLDCPGCGMTRGLHSLVRGDVVRSLDHNVLLVALLFITATVLVWNAIARRIGRSPVRLEFRRATWVAIGLGVLAFWVMRNLPWAPFDWLGSDA